MEVSVEVLAIGILWAPHLAQYLLNVLAHFQNLLVLARSQGAFHFTSSLDGLQVVSAHKSELLALQLHCRFQGVNKVFPIFKSIFWMAGQ